MGSVSLEELRNVQGLIDNLYTDLSSSRNNLRASLDRINNIISELEGYNGAYDSDYGTQNKIIGKNIYEYKSKWSVSVSGASSLSSISNALSAVDDDLAVLDRTRNGLGESIYAIARDIQIADNALAFGDDMKILKGYNNLYGFERTISTGMVMYDSAVMGMVGSGANFLSKPLALWSMTGANGSNTMAEITRSMNNATSQNALHSYNYNFKNGNNFYSAAGNYNYYSNTGYNSSVVENYSYKTGQVAGDLYLTGVSSIGAGAFLKSTPVTSMKSVMKGSNVYRKLDDNEVINVGKKIVDHYDPFSTASDNIAAIEGDINKDSLAEAKKRTLVDSAVSTGIGTPAKKIKRNVDDSVLNPNSIAKISQNTAVNVTQTVAENEVNNIIYNEDNKLIDGTNILGSAIKNTAKPHGNRHLD